MFHLPFDVTQYYIAMKLHSLNQISIPVPCHENWDTMTEAEKGRFCAVCQKTVVDFSQMNEQEILATLNETLKKDSVCGRFHKNQVHATPSWKNKISQKLKYFALALLLAFGMPKVSKAQLHENPNKKEHLVGEIMPTYQGSIFGTVKNISTNIILTQTEVQVWKNGQYLTSVYSNGNGFYQVKNLDPGTYTLKAFKSGYYAYELRNIQVVTETNVTANILLTKLPKNTKKHEDVHVVGMIAPVNHEK